MKVIIMFFYDMYMLIFINCPPHDTHAPHADIITACICMIKHMLQIVSFLAEQLTYLLFSYPKDICVKIDML